MLELVNIDDLSSLTTTYKLISVAGYPLAYIPFSYVESSGCPYGLHVMATANEEDKIIKFMSMWEKTIGPRMVPDLNAL